MRNRFFKVVATLAMAAILAVPVFLMPVLALDFVPYNSRGNLTLPVLGGTNVQRNAQSEIDYSRVRYGYVKVRWLDRAVENVVVQVLGPGGLTYRYNINNMGRWETLPLTCGNGEYTVRVLRGLSDGRFAVSNSLNINVALVDQFAPFLRPNQFVYFNEDSTVVALAGEITANSRTELESVTIVYNWVVDNIEYDFELARTVRSGFVPDLENVLYNRRGICFCYAALMTAMLRSQGIPTQLVFGFVGDVYHAWISIWTEATGWVNNIIQFNGETWRIMDPTFTSTSNRSLEARNLVGNGENHNPTSWR